MSIDESKVIKARTLGRQPVVQVTFVREVLHLTAADVRRLAWKNGRGVTEELALWPLGSAFERGDFVWRISKAAITGPGPFSSFAGCERILVVTEGDGLVLEHGSLAPRARLRRFEPYRFSGDWPTEAAEAQGAISDFNVIARRGSCRAEVLVSRLGSRRVREPLALGHAFVHVLGAGVVARVTGEEEPFELAPGESLWVRGATERDELELLGTGAASVALVVRIALAP
jgi:environmental stress-induced protein Ves